MPINDEEFERNNGIKKSEIMSGYSILDGEQTEYNIERTFPNDTVSMVTRAYSRFWSKRGVTTKGRYDPGAPFKSSVLKMIDNGTINCSGEERERLAKWARSVVPYRGGAKKYDKENTQD